MDRSRRAKSGASASPNSPPVRAARRRRAPLGAAALRIDLRRERGAPPFFEQVRGYVREAVANGTLSVGVRLPPERQLAAALGVSRSTIMRAYQELVADGLVRAAPSRGTVVAPLRPRHGGEPGALADSWLLALPPLSPPGSDAGLLRDVVSGRDGTVSFASSAPPEDLVPVADIAACLQEALAEAGPKLLGYGPVDGLPGLREEIAARMRARGAMTPGDGVIILSGSTQGLALAARVLVQPGDEVAIEAPAYVGAIQTFEMSAARLIGIPVDASGMRTDMLEEILSRRPVRLVIVQPNFQNPTGASLTPQRREHLLWLAGRYSVPVLEDDAYSALYHHDPAPRLLKQDDRQGQVIYLSSFSKTLAPGLRVAWMCAPEPVIARVAIAKQFSDLYTNALGQAVVSRMLSSGRYDTQLDRLREESRERMAVMLRGLDRLSNVLARESDPRGGLHVWCRLLAGDARQASAAAFRGGVSMLAGPAFYPTSQSGQGADRVRLSLPASGRTALGLGLKRLAEALQDLPAVRTPTDMRTGSVIV